MTKKQKAKRKKSERLEYQLKFFASREQYPTRESAIEAVNRARALFLETGEETDGVRIVGRWRNPDNANPLHANWKTTEDSGQSLPEFHRTLHGVRGALRGAVDTTPETKVLVKRIERERKQRSDRMKLYHAKVRQIQQFRHCSYLEARRFYAR